MATELRPSRGIRTAKTAERGSLGLALGSGLGAMLWENHPFPEAHTPSNDMLSSALTLTTLISSSAYVGISSLRRRAEGQPIGTTRWLAIGVLGALDAYIALNAAGALR